MAPRIPAIPPAQPEQPRDDATHLGRRGLTFRVPMRRAGGSDPGSAGRRGCASRGRSARMSRGRGPGRRSWAPGSARRTVAGTPRGSSAGPGVEQPPERGRVPAPGGTAAAGTDSEGVFIDLGVAPPAHRLEHAKHGEATPPNTRSRGLQVSVQLGDSASWLRLQSQPSRRA